MPSPQPLALSDSEITTIMGLARPLLPDQRIAFFEIIATKLRGHRDLGDGAIYRLCRELQREMLIPPLATHHGHVRGVGKYGR